MPERSTNDGPARGRLRLARLRQHQHVNVEDLAAVSGLPARYIRSQVPIWSILFGWDGGLCTDVFVDADDLATLAPVMPARVYANLQAAMRGQR